MDKKKILVTYPIPKEGLQSLFAEFDVYYHEQGAMTREEILSVISKYDGILTTGVQIDADIMDAGGRLRMISVYGAGYDSVDVRGATERGIVVTSIPDVVTEATAELTMGLMISLMRRISECDRRLRTEQHFPWGIGLHLGEALYGKELGIIGMGRIGRAVAKRAAAFGMRISYYNRKRLDPVIEMELGTGYKRLDDLLKSADVLSIHTPLNEETFHLVGERELALLKPDAFLVNTARGAVVDEQALVSALKEGRLAGAALDVLEHEPKIPPELREMPHVVLTPHIGTETRDTLTMMSREAARNIIDLFHGRRPFHVVNPEVFNEKSSW